MSSEKIFKKFKDFENLFTASDLECFLENTSIIRKAKLIAPYIREVCFINTKEKAIYILQENYTYRTSTDIDNNLLTIIADFIDRCVSTYMARNPDKSVEFFKKHSKSIQYNQSNASINQYKPQLITYITENENKFNNTHGEIHFNNGYIITKTGEFKERTTGYLITKYIERDYVQSTKEQQAAVMKAYKQIYPNEKDRDIVLGNISIALSWEATKNQISLFLTGTGSSGKSFVMETLKRAMGPYFLEMKGDTFSNDTKMDKVLNTMGLNPQALYVWMNELVGTKMNTSVFKEFCDGTTNTTKLYEDGSHNTQHNAYVISTSNELPNMIQDSGTKRRIMGYTHCSEFTNDETRINEANHIYKMDKDLKNTLSENAIFDVFLSYCKKWAKDPKVFDVSKSENFQSTSEIMTSSNDFFQDFIDSRLTITNDKADRIGKDRMRDMYLQMYPDKHITVLQVISSLRDKRIDYDKAIRCDNIRGCFIGVKENNDITEEENNDSKQDETISDLKKQLQEMKKKYDEIKKKLNMKRQMEAIDGKEEEQVPIVPAVPTVPNPESIEPCTDYETTEEEPVKKPKKAKLPKQKAVEVINIERPKWADADTIFDDDNDDDHIMQCNQADEEAAENDDITVCFT